MNYFLKTSLVHYQYIHNRQKIAGKSLLDEQALTDLRKVNKKGKVGMGKERTPRSLEFNYEYYCYYYKHNHMFHLSSLEFRLLRAMRKQCSERWRKLHYIQICF